MGCTSSLKSFILCLFVFICFVFAGLLAIVLIIHTYSINDISTQLTSSLHAQAVESVTTELNQASHIARVLADEYLAFGYYKKGPSYNEHWRPLYTYAKHYPKLALLAFCGADGYLCVLRKECMEGETNIIETTNPPNFLVEVAQLSVNSTQADYIMRLPVLTLPYPYRSFDQFWWTGANTPDEGQWIIVANEFTKTINLARAFKIMHPNGTFIAMSFAELAVQDLSQTIKQIDLGRGQVMVLNEEGRICATTTGERTATKGATELLLATNSSNAVTRDVGAYLMNAKHKLVDGENYQINAGGQAFLVSTSKFPFGKSTNWTIAVVIPRSELFGRSDSGLIATLISVFCVFVFVIVFILCFTNSITKRIRKIVHQIDGICQYQEKAFSTSERGGDERSLIKIQEVECMQESVLRMKVILQSFEKYVPVQLLRYLVQQNQPAELGLQRSTATVMFIDVENFTSIMETVPLDRLIEQFTEYSNEAIRIIMANHGTLDKMMGDGMMAFFGCPPTPIKLHQYWAARCALHLQRAMVRMRAKWVKEGHVPFKIRIGLASGNVSVGNVGSQTRFQYTVLGDVVNLASRLEGINKYFHTSILATGHTFEALDQERFVGRQLATIKVKGRTHRTRLYELVTSAEMFSKEFCSSRDLTASQQHLSTGRIMDTGRSSMDEAPALDPNLPSAHSTPTPTHAFLPREMNESLDSHDLITPTSCAPLSLPDSARSADFGSPRAASVQLTMPNGTDWPEQSESASVHDLEELMTASSSHNPLRHDPLFLVDLPQPIKVAPGILRRCAHLCMLFTRAVRCYESKRFRDAARLLNYYRSAEHKSMRRDLHVLEEEFYSQHHKPLPSPSTPHLTPESAANATTHIAQNPILPSSHNAPSVSHQLSFSVINAFQESSLSQRVHTLDFMEGTDYAWELLKRCEDLAQCEVIPEDWDPVITMTEK